MSIKNKIFEYVEEAKNSYDKGLKFNEWILNYLFELSEDEIQDEVIISDGKNDNSIDSYYEEDKILKIIQSKYDTSHDWSEITKFVTDMERLIEDPNKFAGFNKDIFYASDKLNEYLNENKSIEFYYITNNIFTEEENFKIDDLLNKFKEKYNNKNISMNVFDIHGIEDFINMSLDILPKKYQNKKTKLLLKNHFISNITCVSEVELKHFANFINENKDYLFYSNIRNYLKSTPVNKGIVDTFNNKPDDFWYYNNGITIVCDDFYTIKDSILEIISPQIVNGCQTSNTIYNEFRNLKSKEKQNNLQGTLLVKIIKDKNKKRKDEITKNTNRQNAVSGKDFFALDSFQRNMAKKFEEIGYFYEIQNKSSLTKTKKELQNSKGINELKYLFPKKFNNVLPVKKIVQTFASGMHFLPGTASSRSGELMVYGKKWSKIFNDNTTEEPLLWLYPFCVMNYANSYMEYNHQSKIQYKRYSNMFFVACYFRSLVLILKEMGLFSKTANINPLEIEVDYLKILFNNKDINIQIFDFIDSVIKRFMKDKFIKNIIIEKYGSEDIVNFMKSEIETNESVRQILDDFIIEEFAENFDLKEKIEEIFNQNLNCNTIS